MTDLLQAAKDLRVVDVWQHGNETGWVTPRQLYDRSVPPHYAPVPQAATTWIDHGTVGTNTLRYWGTGQSIPAGTIANWLVPKDMTEYADGRVHDTTNVIFKMVPDGFACNHAGTCVTPVGNGNSIGMEYESLQNGTHDITHMQYVKGALVLTNEVARKGIKDWNRVAHGWVAVDGETNKRGRRSDPYAGRFDVAFSWEIVQAVRRDIRIWQLPGWGIQYRPVMQII